MKTCNFIDSSYHQLWRPSWGERGRKGEPVYFIFRQTGITQEQEIYLNGACTLNRSSCAMDFDTGWIGMYAEHRLWKALAVLVGISVQKPIPSVIRSWFPAEMLHHFIRSVGERKVRRIVSLVRQYQWKGWCERTSVENRSTVQIFFFNVIHECRLSPATLMAFSFSLSPSSHSANHLLYFSMRALSLSTDAPLNSSIFAPPFHT